MEQTALRQRVAGKIFTQITLLLDTALTGIQRESVLRIQQAADELLATPDQKTESPPPTEAPYAAASALPTDPARWRILLVEDNPFTQKLMTRLLSQQGYQVEIAQNGQDALGRLAQQRVDLILMDLRMPVMDGFLATTEIRQREIANGMPRVPIIAVTALLSEEDQRHALEVGMDGYHTKPVRAAVLFAEMERLLAPTCQQTNPAAPAMAAETDGEPLIVDMNRLLKTVDSDLELLQEITTLYFADAPRQMARIERGLTCGDANEVREAAHSLKGATGAFGRVEVHNLAFALEQAGKAGDLLRANELMPRLGMALRRMEETIQKEISHLSGELS
ncbi:MAG: response regulator [Magnetococcus sp. YQC-9]